MTVTTYDKASIRQVGELWDFYQKTFKPLAKLAIQNHMMSYGDFIDMCFDERFLIHVSQSTDKWERPINGLAVTTRDLDAWPLISPAWFEDKYPEEYVRKEIWYVCFVGTDRTSHRTFYDLLDVISAPVREVGGVAFMDYCTYNEDLGIPKAAGRYAGRADKRMVMKREDAQGFWSIGYPTITD